MEAEQRITMKFIILKHTNYIYCIAQNFDGEKI